jgi:hypothetical protein
LLSALARTTVVVLVFVALGFAIALVVLNGCAPAGVYVKQAPPSPRHEAMPERPHPNAIWVGGHWTWTGGEYRWTEGRWEVQPGGDAWVPGHWRRTPKGWFWTAGTWTK